MATPGLPYELRPISPADNGAIAAIIRQVLIEFKANCSGFAWADPELDTLATAYQGQDRAYYVVMVGDTLVGGAGFAPFPCNQPHLCELQKMYLLPPWRGRGIGYHLLKRCLDTAQRLGYQGCYLETVSTMTQAHHLYERVGFQPLAVPLGNSGHHGCDRYYFRPLTAYTTELG